MQQKRNNKDKLNDQKLDEQFVSILGKIQTKYLIFNRHIQIRIEKWAEKLLQCDQGTIWRKSRNNYINLLYEMVIRGKVSGVFLKMPPQKDLPNLSDSQYKKTLQQLKIFPKLQPLKNVQVNFARPECNNGDIATKRIDYTKKQNKIQETLHKRHKQIKTAKALSEKLENQGHQLIDKIANLVLRHEKKLKHDPQYQNLIEGLQEIITCKSSKGQGEQDESSAELKVEEGIGANMVNLFQFGSPRGKTQMQYFKAALL